MANQFGIDYGSVEERVGNIEQRREAIKAARIANAFSPRMNEANLRNADQQSQINAMQITQGQNALADDAKIRTLGPAAAGGDVAAMTEIAGISPAKAAEFGKYIEGLDEKGRAAVDRSREETGRLANYVLTAEDPAAAYAEALTLLPENIRKDAPKAYDEKWVKVQLARAVALKDQLTSQAKVDAGAETTLGKLAADLAANRITPEVYAAAVQKETAMNGGTQLSVDPVTGAVSFSQGGPAGAGDMPKLTEVNSKDLGFAARATGALQTLDPVQGELTDFWGSTFSKLPFGNYAQTEEYQQADQAGQEFLAAFLRKDSGAAITKEEKDTYGKLYLPQPGDKPKVLKQKADARKRAVAALKIGIPSQAIRVAEENGIDLTVDLPEATGADGGEGGGEVQASKTLNGKTYVQINGEWFEDDGTP